MKILSRGKGVRAPSDFMKTVILSGAQLGILWGRGPNQKKGHIPDHFKAMI